MTVGVVHITISMSDGGSRMSDGMKEERGNGWEDGNAR